MEKPHVNFTLAEMRDYIRQKKLNVKPITLNLSRAETIATLKKLGHWDDSVKKKKRLPKDTKQFKKADRAIRSATVSKDEDVKKLGITQIELDNNIRINLKQTDFKRNEFGFKVCFGNGKKSEPLSQAGLAILSESVLRGSGLGMLDIDQLTILCCKFKIRFLSNSSDGPVNFNLKIRTLYWNRSSSATIIRWSKFHFNAFNSFSPVFII